MLSSSPYCAISQGSDALVATFIKEKIDLYKDVDINMTPLCLASQCGDRKIVELLLNTKADVDRGYDDGISALNSAASKMGNTF